MKCVICVVMRHLLLIALVGLVVGANAQTDQDSLWGIWSDAQKPDTVRVMALIKSAEKWSFTQPDTAIAYTDIAIGFAEERGLQGLQAAANNVAGVAYWVKGDHHAARQAYTRCKNIAETIGDVDRMANAMLNIGIVLAVQANYPAAMEQLLAALQVAEQANKPGRVADIRMNLGSVYFSLGELDKAEIELQAALQYFEQVNDMRQMAGVKSNLAAILMEQKEYTRSIEMHLEVIEMLDSTNIYSIANVLAQIAGGYSLMEDFELAASYYDSSQALYQQVGSLDGMASCLINKGLVLYNLDRQREAITLCKEGLEIADSLQQLHWAGEACKCLSSAYERLGDDEQALIYYQRQVAYQDSVQNEANTREITQREMEYQFGKQQLADSLAQAEADRIKEIEHTREVQQQRYYTYGGAGGAGLLLVVAVLLMRGYRQKQKTNVALADKNRLIEEQKHEVEHQKEIVEEKNKEITDSITYAKRIQEAILPPDRVVKEYLADSFVLYRPKDIVAGDFYWMEALPQPLPSGGEQKEALPNRGDSGRAVLFAAADCTGHGVPGAMVSVVCHNALNRSVREFGLTDPGKVLDKTRELVIETFEKSDHEVKDGMDIALCALNGNTLYYAGANNPLWIYRKGVTSVEEVEEIKADKQPIGQYAEDKAFTTHSITLNPGDSFYIFTDGYPDQFGGPKGKKLKYKPFKQLLLNNLQKPLAEQRKTLDADFEAWRGELEQVDDVCIIGVKI